MKAETRPGWQNSEYGELPENKARPYQSSTSIGRDESQTGFGNPRITIDLGKSVNSIAICAALCGICAAVAVGVTWHSNEREAATESQYRKTQNHVDEMTNEVKRLKYRL
jgi:hypothetical protein